MKMPGMIALCLSLVIGDGVEARPKYQTNDDYPAAALAAGAQGTAFFEILVGKDGLPKSCRITQSAGHSDLDTASCELVMRRARFHPQINETGDPIEFLYSNRIRWEIPGAPPMSGNDRP